MNDPVNEPTIVVTIREEDPRFCRAVTLANEVVAALVYGVFEPVSGTIFSAPPCRPLSTS